MMIVDLVDEVDFKEMLKNSGVPITDDMSLEQVQLETIQWKAQSEAFSIKLNALISELSDDQITVLPDVQNVIDYLKTH
ncbi:hypothetical protein [Marinomonas mediterranea]|jgi:hypothetical protein|uniref:Carrier domain-containing protein n=1 Tax=Marinomonas mediterranea (strain ATCC 700492 / JCM 21426 / NBRC 103028 / MMB-1) TaxID=717774 RepID=F2K0H3_MARM1|nr:hypothetical protein [Marinomonas mediterranea]ADZ90957.1 hypothetical protein Marme_1700 [Marinomonas mediterranea MMB-1]WCN08993.1 hypothetical protein GV055_08695 [Marinomonas mediterranea]WCN13027.1 hypothetical protein GV054_08425 [Marinomonas mediterranea]WCN17100.1 hypothetical protein GV053_08605 [Marinomonas mediterranea MMB-1]